MSMQLIETKTLGTAAASIEFTSIPQTFTDLVVVASARSSGTENFYFLGFNSLTTNFSYRFLQGNGSTASSGSDTTRPFLSMCPSTFTANTFSNNTIYIPNYAGATNKSISIDMTTENNATESRATIEAGLWSNTSAITSIQFTNPSGDFVIGTTMSLYGILKGSDGIVTTS
jgi:hypothetical protein